MLKPRIVIDSKIPFIAGRLGGGAECVYLEPGRITPEAVRGADALVTRTRTRCDRTLLQDSRVRLVVTATIGTDHIDLPWCETRGICVRNAPGCNAPGVAQYVWSSLLHLGFDPSAHTLGVVGCGNVGGIVAAWGRGLGGRVVVSDPPRQHAGIHDEYMPLHELLRTCDAVTLHTPLTRAGRYPTLHLIGERELAVMRPGAILVNAARGGVVDDSALLRNLGSGRGVRAVIDTWEREPAVDRRLLGMAAYGTPHIAGYSRQGKERATRMALEAVGEWFGIRPDLTGLEGPYRPADGRTPSPEGIISSYDPGGDTEALRSFPGDFERLRQDYNYRDEVKY